LPEGLKRLYIAIDRDAAGERAAERLGARAREAGIACHLVAPRLGDFNDDLLAHGAGSLRKHLAGQFDPRDWHRVLA
jgi:DNA primase